MSKQPAIKGYGAIKVITLALLLGLLAMMATGCASTSAPLMVRSWALEYDPPKLVGMRPLPVLIRVNRLGAGYGFQSDDMVYSPSPLERGVYPYQRWQAAPSDMIGDLLARDLRASGLFAGVLVDNDQGRARFSLQGGVSECIELNRPEGWKARLVLHISLMDGDAANTTERLVLQRDYTVEKDIAQKGAQGLARALSLAASEASAQIAKDLYKAITEQID